jgi:hypothetical protein
MDGQKYIYPSNDPFSNVDSEDEEGKDPSGKVLDVLDGGGAHLESRLME